MIKKFLTVKIKLSSGLMNFEGREGAVKSRRQGMNNYI